MSVSKRSQPRVSFAFYRDDPFLQREKIDPASPQPREKMQPFFVMIRLEGRARYLPLHAAVSPSGACFPPHHVLRYGRSVDAGVEVVDVLTNRSAVGAVQFPSTPGRRFTVLNVFHDLLLAEDGSGTVMFFSTRTGAFLARTHCDEASSIKATPSPCATKCRVFLEGEDCDAAADVSPCGARVLRTIATRTLPAFIDVNDGDDGASASVRFEEPATCRDIDVIDAAAVLTAQFVGGQATTYSSDGRLCALLALHKVTSSYHVVVFDVVAAVNGARQAAVLVNMPLRAACGSDMDIRLHEVRMDFLDTTQIYVCARGRLRFLSVPLGGRLVQEISVPVGWFVCADVVDGGRMMLLHGQTRVQPETIAEPGLIVHNDGEDAQEGAWRYAFFKCVSKSDVFGDACKPLPTF